MAPSAELGDAGPEAPDHGGAGRWILLQEACVAAFAASGPVAMWAAGFDVPLAFAVALSLGATVGTAMLPERRWVERTLVVVAASAALALAGATFAGAWLGGGVLVGEWAIRRRPPLPGLGRCHRSMLLPVGCTWATGLTRAWNPSYEWDPVPRALTLAIALLIVAGMPLDRRPRWALAVTSTIWVSLGYVGAESLNVARRAGPRVGFALLLVLVAAWLGHPDRRWSLNARLGPLWLAAPALLWWCANLSVLIAGSLLTDQSGYRAWRTYASTLPPEFDQINAATAIPFTVLGLLGIGAHLSLRGRAGLRTVSLSIVVAVASTIAVTSSWHVGLAQR